LQIDLIPFVKDVFVPGSEEPVDVPGKCVLGTLSNWSSIWHESRSSVLAVKLSAAAVLRVLVAKPRLRPIRSSTWL